MSACRLKALSTRRGSAAALIAAVLLGISGCSSVQEAPSVAAAVPEQATRFGPVNAQTEKLVGRWGIASYREEKDRARVEAQARAGCKLPYVIAKGPTDGVMIHFADDPKQYELKIKNGSDGKVYLGFEAPPGDWQDREILQFTDRMVTMRFVDPEIHVRYGTFIYVRC